MFRNENSHPYDSFLCSVCPQSHQATKPQARRSTTYQKKSLKRSKAQKTHTAQPLLTQRPILTNHCLPPMVKNTVLRSPEVHFTFQNSISPQRAYNQHPSTNNQYAYSQPKIQLNIKQEQADPMLSKNDSTTHCSSIMDKEYKPKVNKKLLRIPSRQRRVDSMTSSTQLVSPTFNWIQSSASSYSSMVEQIPKNRLSLLPVKQEEQLNIRTSDFKESELRTTNNTNKTDRTSLSPHKSLINKSKSYPKSSLFMNIRKTETMFSDSDDQEQDDAQNSVVIDDHKSLLAKIAEHHQENSSADSRIVEV